MNRNILVLLPLLLAACASPSGPQSLDREYPNYRAYLVDNTMQSFAGGSNATIPDYVKSDFANCAADYVWTGFTTDQQAKLDAWAQHKITMTSTELSDLDHQVKDRLGGDLSAKRLDRLSGTCPDKVPEFQQYMK